MTSDANRRIFESEATAAVYVGVSHLMPPEAAVIEKYRSEIAGAAILDLGVGAGRTTSLLTQLASHYVGVDYSAAMIARARRRFPDVRFAVGDARDLSVFADSSFDFILFSFAGIDAVGHQDRLGILKGIRRVLKPNGLFLFSTHNRGHRIPKPWNLRQFAINPLRHPVKLAKKFVSVPLGMANYLTAGSRGDEAGEEYAIMRDPAHHYSLRLYQIAIAAQVEQLAREGFGDIEALGEDGRWLRPADYAGARDKAVHFVCRRAPHRSGEAAHGRRGATENLKASPMASPSEPHRS